MAEKEKQYPLTAVEIKLIAMLRKMEYGEIVVSIKDGKPSEINEIRQSVLLDR